MKTVKLSKKAIRLLQKTRDYILAEPRRLAMSTWLDKGAKPGKEIAWAYESGKTGFNIYKSLTEEDAPPCGTVGCIAGWVSVLGKKESEKLQVSIYSPEYQARVLLSGINHPYDLPLSDLFHPDQWPKHYKEYQKAKTAKGRARIVAKVINEFIEKYS